MNNENLSKQIQSLKLGPDIEKRIYDMRKPYQKEKLIKTDELTKKMEYKEFTRRLRETGEIYTHGAGFHADDVMATALINKVCDKEGIERPHVNRVFKVTEEMQNSSIVYDVGLGEFDHHQKDNGHHENGIPYAAFGRIWDVVKEELVPDEAKRDIFERRFTETIDMCDNSATNNIISATIRNMNPNWNEDKTPDMKFAEAVEYAEKVLDERIKHLDKDIDMLGILPEHFSNFEDIFKNTEYEFTEAEKTVYIEGKKRRDASIVAAKEKVTELAKSSMGIYKVDNKLQIGIIHADRPGIPYSAFKDYAKENKTVKVMAYTFPARNQYTLKLLNDDLKIPKIWLGATTFDVPGLTFCHPAGISMSCTTQYAAEQVFTHILQSNDNVLNDLIQSLQEDKVAPNIEENTETISVHSENQKIDLNEALKNAREIVETNATKKENRENDIDHYNDK